MLLLERGYYWEVHEVLEPLWMVEPPNGARREGLQGLIQFANGALKVSMGRPGAAARLFAIAREHLASAGPGCGFDAPAIAAIVAEADPKALWQRTRSRGGSLQLVHYNAYSLADRHYFSLARLDFAAFLAL